MLPAPPRLIDFRGSAVQEERLLDEQGRRWRGVRSSPLAPVQLFLELDATGKVPDDQRDVAAAHPGLVQRLARGMQAELQHEGRGFELRWQRPLRKPRSVNPYTWVRFEARPSRPARTLHFLHSALGCAHAAQLPRARGGGHAAPLRDMTCPALVTASVQGSEEEIAKLGTPLNVNKGSTKKLCGALEQALKEGEQAIKKAKVARFGLLTPLQELNLDDGALARAISAAVAFCEGQGATDLASLVEKDLVASLAAAVTSKPALAKKLQTAVARKEKDLKEKALTEKDLTEKEIELSLGSGGTCKATIELDDEQVEPGVREVKFDQKAWEAFRVHGLQWSSYVQVDGFFFWPKDGEPPLLWRVAVYRASAQGAEAAPQLFYQVDNDQHDDNSLRVTPQDLHETGPRLTAGALYLGMVNSEPAPDTWHWSAPGGILTALAQPCAATASNHRPAGATGTPHCCSPPHSARRPRAGGCASRACRPTARRVCLAGRSRCRRAAT